MQENKIEEAGPFSYGAKKPKKGSVTYNAMVKRIEQEKGKKPIEPKDQMVGVAKVAQIKKEELEEVNSDAHPYMWKIEGGSGKGKPFAHKDTSVDDHLSAMKYHSQEYQKAMKEKRDSDARHHGMKYHKHKDQIERLGDVGNYRKEELELDEENLHRVIGQVYSDDDQKWYRQSYTTRAKSREHAVQKAKEQFGKRGQKFKNVEHDAEIHEELEENTEQIKEGDRHTLAKKMTNRMYRIDKMMGKVAKSQNRTDVNTGLRTTKSDVRKAVSSTSDDSVKKMLKKEQLELDEASGKERSAAWHADGGANDEGHSSSKMREVHNVYINGRHWKRFSTPHEAKRAGDAVKKKYPDKSVSVHKTYMEEVEHSDMSLSEANEYLELLGEELSSLLSLVSEAKKKKDDEDEDDSNSDDDEAESRDPAEYEEKGEQKIQYRADRKADKLGRKRPQNLKFHQGEDDGKGRITQESVETKKYSFQDLLNRLSR